MWSEIASLFSGYGIIPMMFILAGTILIIIEIFVPGFGVFGILGSIFTVGGIIARTIMGASLNQFLIMFLSVASIIVLVIIILFLSARFGVIRRTPLIETKTSISTNYGTEDKKLLKMLGKITFAKTEFKPTGKFDYNQETFIASSYGEYIEKGDKIQIVEVRADKIIVKKANE